MQQSLDLLKKQQNKNKPKTIHNSKIMNTQTKNAYLNVLKHGQLSFPNEINFRNVKIYENQSIHEIYTQNTSSKLPHLVMLHGFGGIALTFIRIFKLLKDHFQIHALDNFGIGLSSLGTFKDQFTSQQVKQYYVQAIQAWRKQVGIDRFILAGHSFGGYISSLYFQKYQNRVERLIFLSPVGCTEYSEAQLAQKVSERRRQEGFGRKVFLCIAQFIFDRNPKPTSIMRNFFIGNKVIERILNQRLKLQGEQKASWKKYLQIISQNNQTSETSFYILFKWPVSPVQSIEKKLKRKGTKIPIQFYFGDQDWMDSLGARRMSKQYDNIRFNIISNAGHQLIFDNPQEIVFNILKSPRKQSNSNMGQFMHS